MLHATLYCGHNQAFDTVEATGLVNDQTIEKNFKQHTLKLSCRPEKCWIMIKINKFLFDIESDTSVIKMIDTMTVVLDWNILSLFFISCFSSSVSTHMNRSRWFGASCLAHEANPSNRCSNHSTVAVWTIRSCLHGQLHAAKKSP